MSNELLSEIMTWKNEGASTDDIITRLRLRTEASLKSRGFSRETLVVLFANIESREWRSVYNATHDMLPEHPRASTTDDVEFFFSALRDSVGKDVTLQEVQ